MGHQSGILSNVTFVDKSPWQVDCFVQHFRNSVELPCKPDSLNAMVTLACCYSTFQYFSRKAWFSIVNRCALKSQDSCFFLIGLAC